MNSALLLLCLVAAVAAREAAYIKVAEPITGSYIIKLKADVDLDETVSSVRLAGGRVDVLFKNVLHGFSARFSDNILDLVRRLPGVEYVEQDGIMRAMSVGSWGLDRIDQRNLPLDDSYTHSGTGSDSTAYVIDTGVNDQHVEFGVRATQAWVYSGGTNTDCNGHGTHLAGIVGSTTYGVATGIAIKGVKVLSCFGSGSTSNIIAGIDWAQQDSASARQAVATLALGGGASSSLDTAVRDLVNSGVPTAVAAGNSNADACNYSPSREPLAITVGATTQTDTMRSSSNYGSCVDLFAPGTDITSTWHSSNTATAVLSGSSMACAHVTGGVALYGGDTNAMLAAATDGVLSGVPVGTANQLLYVQ